MPSLDLFTLACVTIINILLSSTAMYCVALLNRQTSGIRDCAIGGFAVAAAFILSLIRGIHPSAALNLISNVMIIGGTIVLLEGIVSFRGIKPLPRSLTSGGIALFAALYALWLWGFDNIQARTVLASFGLALLLYICAYVMTAEAEHGDRWVYWTTGAMWALQATAALIRGLHAMSVIPEPTVFNSSVIDLSVVATANLASMGCAFGLALATNLKLTRESEQLARYDPLTRLPNRRLFEERLEQAERRIASTAGSLALIYCDLDDFKSVNDTLGHEAGDRVLQTVAERLLQALPAEACLARVGGDEFLVLVEQAKDGREIQLLAQRLRAAVEQPVEAPGTGRRITPKISCGMAICPGDVRSASDLVRQADAAMYAVKQRGRTQTPQIVW